MVVSVHIGFRHCGKKTILVIVNYTIKARLLNLTTVIYVLDVDNLNGGKIKNHWCIRLLLSIRRHAVSRSTIFWKNSFEKSLSPILY